MAGETLAELRTVRLNKVAALREKGVAPYPATADRTHFSQDVLEKFDELEGQRVSVAGRLMSFRKQGALTFAHIQDRRGKIQLFLREQVLGEAPAGLLGYGDLHLLDVGDFVEGEGVVMKTQRGEISVLADRLRMLSKSIRPLPDKWAGVQSQDIIRRKRYLHTIMEPEVLTSFQKTAEMVFALRDYLHKEGFTEFQTPILQPMYGGGTAKPFITHLNAFECRMFLAISHELYLKRLIIAGFDNVFTIGRYFRNEGVDSTHNPEFSMLETMSAYKDYTFNMDLVERLFQHVAKHVYGKEEFAWRDHKIELGKPWKRVMMKDAVKEMTGLDFESWASVEDASNALAAHGIKEPVGTVGEALALAYEELVGPRLINPTLVYGHPIDISPLAKPMADDPRFVERFEIVIGGMECGDNWSEQNDPVALKERWLAARELASSLGHDSHPLDTDFLEALEYGMPPTTGLGPGLERMAMLFSGQHGINDVLFFPTVKPLAEEEEETGDLVRQSEVQVTHITWDLLKELLERGALTVPSGVVSVEDLSVKVLPMGDGFRAVGSATLTGLGDHNFVIAGYSQDLEVNDPILAAKRLRVHVEKLLDDFKAVGSGSWAWQFSAKA